jgi:hypothetical protein
MCGKRVLAMLDRPIVRCPRAASLFLLILLAHVRTLVVARVALRQDER